MAISRKADVVPNPDCDLESGIACLDIGRAGLDLSKHLVEVFGDTGENPDIYPINTLDSRVVDRDFHVCFSFRVAREAPKSAPHWQDQGAKEKPSDGGQTVDERLLNRRKARGAFCEHKEIFVQPSGCSQNAKEVSVCPATSTLPHQDRPLSLALSGSTVGSTLQTETRGRTACSALPLSYPGLPRHERNEATRYVAGCWIRTSVLCIRS